MECSNERLNKKYDTTYLSGVDCEFHSLAETLLKIYETLGGQDLNKDDENAGEVEYTDEFILIYEKINSFEYFKTDAYCKYKDTFKTFTKSQIKDIVFELPAFDKEKYNDDGTILEIFQNILEALGEDLSDQFNEINLETAIYCLTNGIDNDCKLSLPIMYSHYPELEAAFNKEWFNNVVATKSIYMPGFALVSINGTGIEDCSYLNVNECPRFSIKNSKCLVNYWMEDHIDTTFTKLYIKNTDKVGGLFDRRKKYSFVKEDNFDHRKQSLMHDEDGNEILKSFFGEGNVSDKINYESGDILSYGTLDNKINYLMGVDTAGIIASQLDSNIDNKATISKEDLLAIIRQYFEKEVQGICELGEINFITNYAYHIDTFISVLSESCIVVGYGDIEKDNMIRQELINIGFQEDNIFIGFPLGFVNFEIVRSFDDSIIIYYNDVGKRDEMSVDVENLEERISELENKLNQENHYRRIKFKCVGAFDYLNMGGLGCTMKAINKETYDKLVGLV